MPIVTLPAHFDGERIRLDEPYDLPPDARLLVTVLPDENGERVAWLRASAHGLANAYGDDEPTYPANLVKERNPDYEGG